MQMNNLTIEQEMNKRNITVEQMSRANTLIQKLVADCERAWSGQRNGHTSFDTYDLIDKIYEIIHGEKKQAVKEFAERLKAKAYSVVGFNVHKKVYAKEYTINEIDINELLKEYEQ